MLVRPNEAATLSLLKEFYSEHEGKSLGFNKIFYLWASSNTDIGCKECSCIIVLWEQLIQMKRR